MSDTPVPDSRTAGLSGDALRGLAGSWWIFLIIGVLWILFGMFVLSYNVGSLLALAVFAGVTFIMTGVTQVIFYGFTELFAAFDLRGLGHRLDRPPPAANPASPATPG